MALHSATNQDTFHRNGRVPKRAMDGQNWYVTYLYFFSSYDLTLAELPT